MEPLRVTQTPNEAPRIAGYEVSDATVLLMTLPLKGFGPGAHAAAGVVAMALAFVFYREQGLAMAAATIVLLLATSLMIRPIAGVAVERGTVVLVKRRYPSTLYAVRLRTSDIAELQPTHVYGSPSLTLRMRAGPSHTIAVGPAEGDPAYEVVINRSGVAFPANTRDGVQMASALSQVIRDHGMT